MYRFNPFLSVFLCRFCAGNWTRDLLQDRALHTPVILLLLGHSSMPAGHDGRGHAHLEHFTSPRWLPYTSSYNHQPLIGIAFPPASRQWLRGVTLLSQQGVTDHSSPIHTGTDRTLTGLSAIHFGVQLGASCVTLKRRRHVCDSTSAGLT